MFGGKILDIKIKTAFKYLAKKYALIDFGVLLLLAAMPVLGRSSLDISVFSKAILYSGLITPAVCFYELKKTDLLPFFDNLRAPVFVLFGIIFLLKIIIHLAINFYA